jgi:hypothetical protein
MERVRWSCVAVALLWGCTYPDDFRFGPDSDALVDTGTLAIDTGELDTAIAETTPETSPPDTNKPESDACGGACVPSEPCVDGACRPFASCAALLAAVPGTPNGAYAIDPDGAGPIAPFNAYCEMVADGGGWTLALKIDGSKKTFVYDAPLWTNKDTFNPTATALDNQEAKLASYTTMPFTKLRVGMQSMGVRRYIVLNVVGTSLHDVMTGPPVTTVAGRAEWRKLLADPLLQTYCDAEGLNQDFTAVATYSARIRIGIMGNNENDCGSPDSFIGFGGGFPAPHMCVGTDPGIVVGNYNPASCGNTVEVARSTIAFGFVFVR